MPLAKFRVFSFAFPDCDAEEVATAAGSALLFRTVKAETVAGCWCQDFLMTKFKAQVFAVFIYGRVKYVCLCEVSVCVSTPE